MSTFKRTVIEAQNAPKAVGTYSQGVLHNGVYYFSGQIGINPENNELQSGFEAQLNQILKNIDGLLESQSLTRSNILKTTIFLTDLKSFGAVNSAYEAFFTTPFPARSCVEVKGLPKGALIEIEVIAGV